MTAIDAISRAREEYVTGVAAIIARCFPLDQIEAALLHCDYESKDTLWTAHVMVRAPATGR